MKKILAILFLFPLLLNVALADTLTYYAGFSGGITYNTADVNQSSTDISIPSFFYGIPGNSVNIESIGGVGQLQIGIGIREEVFYLGLELSGQLLDGEFGEAENNFRTDNPGDGSTVISTNAVELKLNSFEAALDLKPGIFLSDVLLYARIGVGVNELTLQQRSLVEMGTPGGTIPLHVNDTESKTVFPFRLGLGLEHHFTEDLSITADYIYSFYPSISTTASGADVTTIPGTEVYATTSNPIDNVRRQVALLGFNYYL